MGERGDAIVVCCRCEKWGVGRRRRGEEARVVGHIATNGASEGEGVRWEVITLCPCGGGIRAACATVAAGAAGCVVLWCCWLCGAALFHLLLLPILNLVHRIAVAAARAKTM